jgi:hypothetical protein
MRPVGSQADRSGFDMPAPHEHRVAWRVAGVDVCALWRRIFDSGVPGEGTWIGGPAETSALSSAMRAASRQAPGREAQDAASSTALAAEPADASPAPRPDRARGLAASPAARTRSPGTAADSARAAPQGPASDARAMAPEVAPRENGTAPAATVPVGTAPRTSVTGGGLVATDPTAAADASDSASHDGTPVLSGAVSEAAGIAGALGTTTAVGAHASARAPDTAADRDTGFRGDPSAGPSAVTSSRRGVACMSPALDGPHSRPAAPQAAPCDRDRGVAREAVHVRCRPDGSVAVVVRDTALEPALAVRWSLATAYVLRGEHAALQRVTLNGRTVYQRAAAPGAPHAAADRLCFAC